MRVRAAAAVIAAACVISTGCGAAASGAPSRAATPDRPHLARTGRSPATRPGSPSPSRAPSRAAGRQLITVMAAAYGATYGVLTAYTATPGASGGWSRVLGPWTARLGNAGLAPPGQKREGDGRTPSGTYRFGFFFGVRPNPGVAFPYRRPQPDDVWDDDPSSPLYNEWVDDRRVDPGASPEPMYVSGYDYGAVIAYNTARTPGLGSAIFLHVNIGHATTGCVTLPVDELLKVLRWLRPGESPRIHIAVMGG
jgi:L,D-peptidoglycan transpeptidase YkuD (ErfK/YbiS/YcfS/YnhG family)